MASKKLKKYRVVVTRTSYSSRDFDITAHSIEEAKQVALDNAGDYEFSEKDANYEVDGVYPYQSNFIKA
jgi:hypothetical protein